MANEHKGESRFEVDGKPYTMRFSADAICNLEDKFDMSTTEIFQMVGDAATMRMSKVRDMFVIGLRDQHSELDEGGAKEVFKRLMPTEAMRIVVSAFSRSYSGEEPAAVDASPQQPGGQRDGTGPAS